ncbi:MAG: hypothetical protein HYW77_02605 [Parcubacteria group bacterium]|nr:hypothetical protein [Parcubacteria group bacterium]
MVPKSTLSYWLKGIKLSDNQLLRLKRKRKEAAKKASQKKSASIAESIRIIQEAAGNDIKKISDRELWLMGIALYWRERYIQKNVNDLRKGVRFTSSDPYLIKLFLKWLQGIGGLKDEEISFDIFLKKSQKRSVEKVIDYWSQVTNSPKKYFSQIYFQKTARKKNQRNITKKVNFGLLRIRVRASSMLARQISGWINGIVKYYRWSDLIR